MFDPLSVVEHQEQEAWADEIEASLLEQRYRPQSECDCLDCD